MIYILLRKEKAGADSFGNTWDKDGSTVLVSLEQATVLLSIRDAGFSEVSREDKEFSESPPKATIRKR